MRDGMGTDAMSLGSNPPHIIFRKIARSTQPAGDDEKSTRETMRCEEIGRATVVSRAIVESEAYRSIFEYHVRNTMKLSF